MNYFLLSIVVVGNLFQSIFQKQYSTKLKEVKNSQFFYFFAMSFSAFVFAGFVALFGFTFHKETLIFALAFAFGFLGSIIFLFLAIGEGALSLTYLVSSFSLIVPIFYGIVFLNETLSLYGGIGLGILAFSIIFINGKGKKTKINVKWCLFALFHFICNGACATVQKAHQTIYVGQYRSMFMLFSMLAVTVVSGILFFVYRPKNIKTILKKGGVYASSVGLLNGLHNTLVLILATGMPAYILYPLISAGGIVLTFVASIVIYKERYSIGQYIGFILGIAAIIMLNI